MWHPKILIAIVVIAEITFLSFTTSMQETYYDFSVESAEYATIELTDYFDEPESIYTEEEAPELGFEDSAVIDIHSLNIYGSKQEYTDEQQGKIDAAMQEAKLFTKHLDLEGLYLKFVNRQLIEDCIQHRITQITLKNNYMKYFPFDLHQIPTLEALDLSYNQIQFATNLQFFDNLTTLNLANNQLEALPFGINSLTNMTQLNLRNNNIDAPMPSSVNGLHRLRKIDISGNNWNQMMIKDWKRKLPNVEVISD